RAAQWMTARTSRSASDQSVVASMRSIEMYRASELPPVESCRLAPRNGIRRLENSLLIASPTKPDAPVSNIIWLRSAYAVDRWVSSSYICGAEVRQVALTEAKAKN